MQTKLTNFFETSLIYNNRLKHLIFIKPNSEISFFKQAHIKCIGFELIIAYIESNKLILDSCLINLQKQKSTYKGYINIY